MGSPNQRTCRKVQYACSLIYIYHILCMYSKKKPIVLIRIKIPQKCDEKKIYKRTLY